MKHTTFKDVKEGEEFELDPDSNTTTRWLKLSPTSAKCVRTESDVDAQVDEERGWAGDDQVYVDGQGKHVCGDCSYSTDNPELLDLISDVHERVMSGEIHPSGECPECGALVQCEEDFIVNNLPYATDLLTRLGYTVVAPVQEPATQP